MGEAMRRTLRTLAVLAATVGVPAAASAFVSVRCDEAPTTALGSAIATAAFGNVLAITGICEQNVVIQQSLNITNRTGDVPASLSSEDGIQGQLLVYGTFSVFVSGITFEGNSTDTGLISSTVLIDAGGAAQIENSQIVNGQRVGLAVGRNAFALVLNSSISNNGLALIAGQSDGAYIAVGGHLQLGATNIDGTINASDAVTISGNNGNGIFAGAHSGLSMVGGSVEDNAQDGILVAGTSTAALYGVQITQNLTPTYPGGFAVQVLGASALLLAEGSSISGGTAAGGLQVGTASGAIIIGSTVANNTASHITVQASGGSNIILSGGNTITNSAGGGVAIQVDHVGSLMQNFDGPFLPEFGAVAVTPAPDTITGNGAVQLQSTVDVGVGLVGGLPSLSWSGTITAAQNSSLRMNGGATVTGAVSLSQGSNGFFNTADGGQNVVTGGVSCPFTSTPASHVAGNTKVLLTPGGSSAVTIGMTSPDCLGF
jgi:hypothetical protein